MNAFLKSTWWVTALRWSVGAMLVYAGVMKVGDPEAFADSIHTFRLIPAFLIPIAALSVPVLEIMLGLLLVTGVKRRACAMLAFAMSLVFVIMLTQALARGLDVDCGCFGSSETSLSRTVWALARAAGMAGASFIILVREQPGLDSISVVRSGSPAGGNP